MRIEVRSSSIAATARIRDVHVRRERHSRILTLLSRGSWPVGIPPSASRSAVEPPSILRRRLDIRARRHRHRRRVDAAIIGSGFNAVTRLAVASCARVFPSKWLPVGRRSCRITREPAQFPRPLPFIALRDFPSRAPNSRSRHDRSIHPSLRPSIHPSVRSSVHLSNRSYVFVSLSCPFFLPFFFSTFSCRLDHSAEANARW